MVVAGEIADLSIIVTSRYTVINHGERGPAGTDVWWKIEILFLILNWLLWLVKSYSERL